jgi:hypothetical protein
MIPLARARIETPTVAERSGSICGEAAGVFDQVADLAAKIRNQDPARRGHSRSRRSDARFGHFSARRSGKIPRAPCRARLFQGRAGSGADAHRLLLRARFHGNRRFQFLRPPRLRAPHHQHHRNAQVRRHLRQHRSAVDSRRVRSRRVDGPPAVVRRQRWHDRSLALLPRLQACGRAQSAAPTRHLLALRLDRHVPRPLLSRRNFQPRFHVPLGVF